MTTLGEAFIEVHADTRPFDKELAAKIKSAVAAMGDEGKKESIKAGSKIGKGIQDGLDKEEPKVRNRFVRLGMFFKRQADKWGNAFQDTFTKMAKGNFILTRVFGQMALAAGGATRRVVRLGAATARATGDLAEFAAISGTLVVKGLGRLIGIATDVAGTLTTLQASGTKVAASLGALFTELVSLGAPFVAVAAAAFLLTGAFVVLAGVLVVIIAPFATLLNLLLTLPTLFTLLVAAIIPLVVGLNGLGDALALVFEKDPKKFAEGLKKLSPVMREVTNTLRPFRKQFEFFRNAIQTSLFEPILQVLGPALRALLPILTGNLAMVASALGKIIASVLQLVSSRAALNGIATIMGEFATFLANNAGVVTTIIDALGRAAVAALPIVLQLLDKFNGFLVKFADWITGAISDGRFEGWLQTALDDLKSIWGLIEAIIKLFAEMFTQTDEGGRKFLDKITDAINKITVWMQSPEGKKGMQDMVDLAILFAEAFELVLKWVKLVLESFIGIKRIIEWILDHPIGRVLAGPGAFVADHFSGGGVVPQDEMAFVHKGEPILDPANSVTKNQAILQEAGMLDVLGGSTVVNVFIGAEQLNTRIDQRIGRNNQINAHALLAGPRGV